MLKTFLKETPQAASIAIGLACAGLALEALRTPAVRNVTFEVFHPIPYLIEGIGLLIAAFVLGKASKTLRSISIHSYRSEWVRQQAFPSS